MKQKLTTEQLNKYAEYHLDVFHKKCLDELTKYTLNEILNVKNPYRIFPSQHILTASDLIKSLLDAFLQSQEETLFGNFLEELAIFVCGNIFGGIKTQDLEGIDLLFFKNKILYIVEIKSGPNWGNRALLTHKGEIREIFRGSKEGETPVF